MDPIYYRICLDLSGYALHLMFFGHRAHLELQISPCSSSPRTISKFNFTSWILLQSTSDLILSNWKVILTFSMGNHEAAEDFRLLRSQSVVMGNFQPLQLQHRQTWKTHPKILKYLILLMTMGIQVYLISMRKFWESLDRPPNRDSKRLGARVQWGFEWRIDSGIAPEYN